MKNFILFILLFLSSHLFSQAIIKGKVVDAISREPIEYAIVDVYSINGKVHTTTDINGNFIIQSGNQIAVSFLGYQSTTLDVQQNQTLVIALKPAAINLKDFVIQNNTVTKFSTISKIDLSLKPVSNSQELLRVVPGLFIAQHAGGGKAEQIFLRGFDCDHGTDIQVSVDGMPVNMMSHAHGQGYADAHFIIPETVNNIDFGAGPYYTDHGNLNTAGYVAFGTYKNIAKSTIQVEKGQYNSTRGLAMIDLLKKNKDHQSAYIAAEYHYTDGPTINPQNFNRYNIFGKYNLSITQNTQLSLSLSTFKSKWNASGQIPTRAVEDGSIDRFGSIDPSEGGNTQRQNANLIIKHRFNNGSNFTNQLYYTKYDFNLYSNFSFYLKDSVNGDEIQQAESRNIFGYTGNYSKQHFWDNTKIESTYGFGFRHDAISNSQLANTVKRVFLSNVLLGDIQETNAFSFMQQEISSGKWLINAGLRLDYFHFNYKNHLSIMQNSSQQKTILSPKLNIQYTINKQVQVFIKTGKGFHSNDTRVVVANEGRDILPAAYGSDLGIVFKPTNKTIITFAAWQLFLDQEFVYVGDDGIIEPSGKSIRKGIDITTRHQFTNHIFANANIDFTQPRAVGVEKGMDYIPLAPTLTSTGGLFYKTQKGFYGGINYRYIQNRPANEDNSIVAKGYFLMDASINYTQPSFEIGLSAENIFNIKWNEAQFATSSRLQSEPAPVTELNFTPGTPFFAKLKLAIFF